MTMQIYIQNCGRSISLEVERECRVKHIKNIIWEREGIPTDLQLLKFFGKTVNDNLSLSELNIQELNVFELSMRLLGGVHVIVKSVKGPSFTLDVELSDTVEHLKQKIQEAQKDISLPEITLALKGKKLENGLILNSLNVKENTVLLMMRNPQAKLAAKVEDTTPPKLCLNGCGFYGTNQNEGYCSKCYKTLGFEKNEDVKSEPKVDSKTDNNNDNNDNNDGKDNNNDNENADNNDDNNNNDNSELQTDPRKCWKCTKKVGLLGFSCKCGYIFCAKHRYSDLHNCSFDYREQQKISLEQKLEKVVDRKVQEL